MPQKDREQHAGKTRRLEAEGHRSPGEPVDAVLPTWSQPVTQEHKCIHNFLLFSRNQAPHSSYAIPTYRHTNRFVWLSTLSTRLSCAKTISPWVVLNDLCSKQQSLRKPLTLDFQLQLHSWDTVTDYMSRAWGFMQDSAWKRNMVECSSWSPIGTWAWREPLGGNPPSPLEMLMFHGIGRHNMSLEENISLPPLSYLALFKKHTEVLSPPFYFPS